MSRTIAYHCEGPYDPATDDVTGMCRATESAGWDDPKPEGWIFTMMGADLCPECVRLARSDRQGGGRARQTQQH